MTKEQELQEENARLRKVLAEYANKENWEIYDEYDDWYTKFYRYLWVGEDDNPVKMAQDVLEESKE